jgi:hypothetical protein
VNSKYEVSSLRNKECKKCIRVAGPTDTIQLTKRNGIIYLIYNNHCLQPQGREARRTIIAVPLNLRDPLPLVDPAAATLALAKLRRASRGSSATVQSLRFEWHADDFLNQQSGETWHGHH